MNLRNKTKNFFSKEPKYVFIIEAALGKNSKLLEIILARLHDTTLLDLSKHLDISQERIRQLEKQALIKLDKFISKLN